MSIPQRVARILGILLIAGVSLTPEMMQAATQQSNRHHRQQNRSIQSLTTPRDGCFAGTSDQSVSTGTRIRFR